MAITTRIQRADIKFIITVIIILFVQYSTRNIYNCSVEQDTKTWSTYGHLKLNLIIKIQKIT